MDCSHEERSRHSSSHDILPNSKGRARLARACVRVRALQSLLARARVRARVEV